MQDLDICLNKKSFFKHKDTDKLKVKVQKIIIHVYSNFCEKDSSGYINIRQTSGH